METTFADVLNRCFSHLQGRQLEHLVKMSEKVVSFKLIYREPPTCVLPSFWSQLRITVFKANACDTFTKTSNHLSVVTTSVSTHVHVHVLNHTLLVFHVHKHFKIIMPHAHVSTCITAVHSLANPLLYTALQIVA